MMAELAGPAADVVGEYDKATLKARYELLKEYKQGLLIKGDVDEEIELYKESLAEAEASSSAMKMNIESQAPAVRSTINEPDPAASEPRATDEPKDASTEIEKAVER
ncbi:hypothetical protein TIFTF001_028615 [Ficus carica]|uniref:Uncharacterized protein n=1 Tax=Ficus carica TaxID=3494 RepID=A0AA88DQ80_FICCA|nr:hypothetical protein TIFTF001_028615 [Ficus carica]